MKPVLWLLLVAALPVQAGTLRCKNALLTEGDTTAELLVRCGQPMLKEDLTRFEENGFGARVTVKYAERWTYNFGKREFMQFVTVRALDLQLRQAGIHAVCHRSPQGRVT